MENYLLEGVNQAAEARELTSQSWNDIWKNYAVNYALNRASNQDQLNLWNLMNEYNSPENQMKRFKDAGLNPNLIYTQGTNGNASSPASYTPMKAEIFPQREEDRKWTARLNAAMDVINAVGNLSTNLTNIMDQGLNLRLKQNEVKWSDFNASLLDYNNPLGGMRYNMPGHSIQDALNPLSAQFDPLQFLFFQKQGALPQFWNNFLTGESTRGLQKFRADYQKYYNENLLPKFNEFQQGKIDLQEIEKQMNQYEFDVTNMLPPELRGIIEPLVQYLSPFLKLIFKRTKVTR